MVTPALRRSFFAFHLTLGAVLLFLSLRTAMAAFAPAAGHASPHVGLLGVIEAAGAALFLFPRSLRVGAALLLVSIGLALLIHARSGEFRGDLLIYGSAIVFVMVHGPAWPRNLQERATTRYP